MRTFVLVPGAGGVAAYWDEVAARLRKAGHDAIPVELPGADEAKGIDAYAEIVIRAIGDSPRVTIVAQSLGGFTAGVLAGRIGERIERVVFLNAMIPKPGETAGEWWGNTGSEEARKAAARAHGYAEDFDLATYFLHDLSPEVAKQVEASGRPEAKIVFREKADFARWPPVTVIIGKDDRFFPADFQRRVARERLGNETRIVEVPGGHLAALSHPDAVAELLLE